MGDLPHVRPAAQLAHAVPAAQQRLRRLLHGARLRRAGLEVRVRVLRRGPVAPPQPRPGGVQIIAITLGTVASASFVNQLAVLSTIALVITLGVYGLVAGIVKLDDAGLYLSQRSSAFAQSLGRGLLALAPWLMKTLSVVGTAAMFMVGGGILSHGLPPVETALHHAAEWAAQDVGLLSALLPTLFNALLGIVAGLLSVPLVGLGARLWRALRPSTAA